MDLRPVSFIFPYEIQKYGCPLTGCTHMIAGSHRVYESVNGAIGATSSARWHVNSGDLTKEPWPTGRTSIS